MKRKFIYFLAFAFLMPLTLSGCSLQTEVADPSVDMSIRQITTGENTPATEMLNEARSAVVGVSVELGDGYAIGSGVAIAEGGYVLTNYHVVEGAQSITLYYADKTTGTASYLWGDSSLDMAIIKSSKNLPYLATGSVKDVLVGEEVYALGTPLTLQFKNTVTKGIVSALDRTIEVESAAGTSFLQSLIQHDASINPGNSGGALLNARGEVIGINTLKASEGEGIGFAIPIDIGKSVMSQIVKNKSYVEPYLGVFGFDSDIAELYGERTYSDGVYVVSVNGPASDIGLKKGDVIIGLNDMETTNILDLRIALFSLTSINNVAISYIRNGVNYSVLVNLSNK